MDSFPQVYYNKAERCKLFNTATMKYLSLSEAGYITTLNDGEDSKVIFDLHFFHTLDDNKKETQLVVPVHFSQRCLTMTPDKQLDISKKNISNIQDVKKADNSFFYFKCIGSGDIVVFEGMNGNKSDSNYFLAVNEKNMKLQLQKKEGENFPRNMIFQRLVEDENEL